MVLSACHLFTHIYLLFQSDVRIVGASAWNPRALSHNSHQNLGQIQQTQTCSRSQSPRRIDTTSITTTSKPTSLAAAITYTAASVLFGDPSSNLSFTIITFEGTHIDCVALSTEDRETWLAAIQVGLHISVSGYMEALSVIAEYTCTQIYLPLSAQQQLERQLYESNKLVPPSPRVRESQLDYSTLHPLLQYIVAAHASPSTSTDSSLASNIHLQYCTSCGRLPPEHTPNHLYGYPLVQYGLENTVSTICYPCLIGQGVLRHVMTMVDLYAADAMDRSAFISARKLVFDQIYVNQAEYKQQSQAPHNGTTMERLLSLFQNPTFVTYRSRSQRLDQSCFWLERRIEKHFRDQSSSDVYVDDIQSYISEYIELLNQQEVTGADNQSIGFMKKEALKVAGDMGTAIKLLYEYAIPHSASDSTYSSRSVPTEMFSSILDFFLDLCRDGDLASVAFYWPQICQIHLQMLPPLDMNSLARVELMEDFLITVSTKYSIHLALELTYNCVADLEESFGPNRDSAAASCRRRKFALLRFVSELESYIFDFDGGWGGGSISLRGLLTPSEHQGTLIRSTMAMLQMHRQLFSQNFVTGSTRLEKLKREALDRSVNNKITNDSNLFLSKDNQHIHATRKLNLARNAEYFHVQVMFTRRLGDIAEKLRFIDDKDRLSKLQFEIELINASGCLGGDPINKITEIHGSLINVLRIPPTECHVFRSKARTPILLLMEVERGEFILDPLMSQRFPDSTITSILAEGSKISIESHDEEATDLKSASSKFDSSKPFQKIALQSEENDSPELIASSGSSKINSVLNSSDEGPPLTPRRKSFTLR